jgi:hypothetical protein
MQCRLPRAQLRHTYGSQFIPVKRYCLFFIILYSERQKYGINSLKIKHIFFFKSLDVSILFYKKYIL